MKKCAWHLCRKAAASPKKKGRFCSLACQRKWHVREHRRRAKLKAVELKGGKCSRCGYKKCIAALAFHHRDPSEKEFDFHYGQHRSWELLIAELEKCDLLCKNCHEEVHEEWRSAAEAEGEAAEIVD